MKRQCVSFPLFLPACPSGTYKPEGAPGGLSTCLSCPDPQHTSQPGSTSVSDCICKPGYQPVGMTCQSKTSFPVICTVSFTLIKMIPLTLSLFSCLKRLVIQLACVHESFYIYKLKHHMSFKTFPRISAAEENRCSNNGAF